MLDHNATTTDPRLNRLYWASTQTVDEILAQAGIGRNTLYTSIEPFPTGRHCPSCAEPVVFTNRTNRSSGIATCLSCGIDTPVPDEFGYQVMEPRQQAGAGSVRETGLQETVQGISAERSLLIGGGAALGLMVGAMATRALRD